MKIFRIALFASLAIGSASTALAQYGLYGSPETLRTPQPSAEPVYAAPAAYPTTAAPVAQPSPQPAPSPTYYYPPQPQYRPVAQPQYSYPAQPQATAAYQPYQPGAQYRYPGPSARSPMRTAAVEPPATIQPIPAPPGMPSPNQGPAPQASSLTNQMLAEEGGYGYGGCQDVCPSCGPYRALGQQQPACGPSPNGCGYDSFWGNGTCCPWYASLSALVLGRSEGRRLWTSHDPAWPANQITNTQDIPLAWKWGGEVRLGRRFCWCGDTWDVEATYWTTEAFSGYISTTNPNTPYSVSTPLRVGEVQFNGTSATTWFDGAAEHRLWRRNEFHNIEVNMIREQVACTCDSPWDIGWALGMRYFRFEENLTFGSLESGHRWGEGGGAYEAYFNDTITNNLLGFQFGFDAGYRAYEGFRLFVSPKVGIYDNHMNQNFRAYLGNGTIGTTGSSGVPGTYPVVASRDGLAFLTQIDLGAEWQFSRNWGARVGYRLVAMTGVALADDQFVQYLVDIPEIAHIDNHASLLLHGAFAGVTYNF